MTAAPGVHHKKLSSLGLRWLVLLFSCLCMTGVYYSFDIPAALHQQLKDYMTSKTTANGDSNTNYAINFNLLYTVYSIPNIILPFVGGTIVDKLKSHNAALLFVTFTFVGQILFAIGVSIQKWNVMLLGRIIYGLGGENITVATSTLNSIYFQGKELALAFGINLAVSRMGSVFNNFMSPILANNISTPFAIWFGVLMNLISVIAIGVVIYLNDLGEKECVSSSFVTDEIQFGINGGDSFGVESLSVALLSEDYERHEDKHYHNEQVGQEEKEEEHFTFASTSNNNDNTNKEDDEVPVDTMDSFHDNHHSQIIIEERQQLTYHTLGENEYIDPTMIHNNDSSDNNDSNSDINSNTAIFCSSFSCIQDVRHFGPMFWLLSLSCVVVYGCVLPFNNIASGVLLERNYFKTPPLDCVLAFPNQCTDGSLVPTSQGGNPATDGNGNTCPMDDTIQPILPTSINVTSTSSSSSNNDDNSKYWDHTSYQFNNLTTDDIDCGDKFWSQACTQNYCKAQQHATETAGRIMSIPYFLSALLSPFCGHLVDKFGHRAFIACFASIILIGVHLVLALSSTISPVFPLIGQGVAYTLYASVIWPSVPLTVKEHCVGSAYGAITAIQNIGLALFPLIIATIYTASDDLYIPNVEFFFVACAVCGTVVGVLLNVFDSRNGFILNKVERRIVLL